eukprot:1485706-Rhodomonas_salina.4
MLLCTRGTEEGYVATRCAVLTTDAGKAATRCAVLTSGYAAMLCAELTTDAFRTGTGRSWRLRARFSPLCSADTSPSSPRASSRRVRRERWASAGMGRW